MSQLGNRLRRHARERPDARAVFAGERWWTYRELAAAAETIAGALAIAPGDVVACTIARGIEPVLVACAAALRDAAIAVIEPDDAARTLERLCPAIAIASGDLALAGTVPTVARARVAWQPIARPGVAFVIFTSGSTVDAKGVAWSETRAAFDLRMNPPTELQRAAPSAIAVPLSTALGLQDALRTIHDGVATVLLDVPFRVGLEQARALGVNRMRLTPTHVDVLLATATELPALRIVVVASAPIAPKKLAALAARLPNARVGRSYGLTESGAATMLWFDRNPKRAHTVGRAIAYRRITIRDADGRVLPPKTWGEVVIEVPAWDRGDGYLDAPPELARRFDNAVLHTGDRGKLDRRGFLVLGARHAEIVKVGGRSVSAPHVEQVLAGAGGIAELAIVGVADRTLGEVPCALYVPRAGAEPRALTDATTALRADEVPRWVLPRHGLPRAANGKLKRGLLAREANRWAAAFTQVVAPADRTFPAYALDPRTAVVDAGVAPWFGDPGARARAGRTIALVAQRSIRVLALGYVQCGAPGAPMCRFVVGPIAVEQSDGAVARELLDVFAAELARLVALLPGREAELVYTLAAPHASWTVRGAASATVRAAADAAAVEVAAIAQQLLMPGS